MRSVKYLFNNKMCIFKNFKLSNFLKKAERRYNIANASMKILKHSFVKRNFIIKGKLQKLYE